MGDRTRGLYGKFSVVRVDGSSAPGGKHNGCEYFVLDVTHDPHAVPALRAYAQACAPDYPLLAADLTTKAIAADRRGRSSRAPGRTLGEEQAFQEGKVAGRREALLTLASAIQKVLTPDSVQLLAAAILDSPARLPAPSSGDGPDATEPPAVPRGT